MQYVVFEYMYRDAGNWKTFGETLLVGEFCESLAVEIWLLLGADGFFVAEQIGVPALQPEHHRTYGGSSDLDHAFHQFCGLRAATPDESRRSTVSGQLTSVADAIRKAEGEWDCARSPLGRW
ncbi:MAG: hypothetical protein WAS23_08655 [Dokdonella sp.]|uniref:hypothetical protein n=1 Tax=Dokdonella sp. TaxID=2291710 RepID=UPI003BAFA316